MGSAEVVTRRRHVDQQTAAGQQSPRKDDAREQRKAAFTLALADAQAKVSDEAKVTAEHLERLNWPGGTLVKVTEKYDWQERCRLWPEGGMTNYFKPVKKEYVALRLNIDLDIGYLGRNTTFFFASDSKTYWKSLSQYANRSSPSGIIGYHALDAGYEVSNYLFWPATNGYGANERLESRVDTLLSALATLRKQHGRRAT